MTLARVPTKKKEETGQDVKQQGLHGLLVLQRRKKNPARMLNRMTWQDIKRTAPPGWGILTPFLPSVWHRATWRIVLTSKF